MRQSSYRPHFPKWAALAAAGAATLAEFSGCSQAATATTITVSDEVLLKEPPRLGVNIGESTYYNDQQVVANPFIGGDFPKGRQALMVRVANASGNEIGDEGFQADDPDLSYASSFAGGEYYVATGARAGERGGIVNHDLARGRYTLEKSGQPIGDGELVFLRGPYRAKAEPAPQGEEMLGIGDFRLTHDDGVSVSLADAEDDPLDQYVKITFQSTGARLSGGLRHYIAPVINNTYRVHVRARSAFPGAELGIGFDNYGIEDGPDKQVEMRAINGSALTQGWKDFVFEGRTSSNEEMTRRFSAITIAAVVTTSPEQSGEVYIDRVSLEDETLAHPTGFAAPVVEALHTLRPGTLRFYGIAGLSNLADALLASDAASAPWSYLGYRSGFRIDSAGAVLNDWLKLSAEVNARPWITVGSANTPHDWRAIVSYLAAPEGFDEWSARRAAQGQAEPWTTRFDKIYLEFGNEWWNAIFRPYYIWEPERYGEMCRRLFDEVRAHPHFDTARIELVAGGWAVNAHHWNGLLDAASEGHNRISIAPYLVHELERYGSSGARYATLFADVEGYRAGGGASTLKDLRANGKPTQLAVYELNTHITGGRAPASVASEIAPSQAAGVAVLDQALSLMSDMQAAPINYFTLLQRAFGQGEDRREGMWGIALRRPTGKLRLRPVGLGMQLANASLIEGDLLRVAVGESPTWNHEANGSVPELANVPYVHAFAFAAKREDGRRGVNVLAINRHMTEALRIRFALPFEPDAAVQRIALSADSPAANNEDEESVRLEEEEFRAAKEPVALIAPHAAEVFRFTERAP